MQSLTKTTAINASPEEVWAVLAEFADIHKWSPSVTDSFLVGEVASGVGAGRACKIPMMGGITEWSTGWTEGESMELRVEGAPMIREMTSVWQLLPGPEATTVRAEVHYQPGLGVFGAIMGATMMRLMMSRQLDKTLGGLKDYVEAAAASISTSA